MSNISLAIPSKDSLKAEVQSWSHKANALQITDAESCRNVSFLLRSIKGVMSDIDTAFQPELDVALDDKRKADAERKRIVDERDAIKAPLVQAEPIIKRKLLAYEQAQERARLDEEKRLQLEAQKHAESVTLAVAADLELQAAATGDTEMLEEANAILAQPIDAPVVHVKPTMPKVHGITYRDQWKAHPQIDIRKLAAAVASGAVPAGYLLPNMPALNQVANPAKRTGEIPGVRFWNDRQIAARG